MFEFKREFSQTQRADLYTGIKNKCRDIVQKNKTYNNPISRTQNIGFKMCVPLHKTQKPLTERLLNSISANIALLDFGDDHDLNTNIDLKIKDIYGSC